MSCRSVLQPDGVFDWQEGPVAVAVGVPSRAAAAEVVVGMAGAALGRSSTRGVLQITTAGRAGQRRWQGALQVCQHDRWGGGLVRSGHLMAFYARL